MLLLILLVLLVSLVAKALILITETALRLNSIIITQTNGDNIHEANKATVRTVHQSYKNSMRSLQNDSTQRYDLTDVKITKIGVKM